MPSGERPAQGDVSTHGDLYAPAAEPGSLLERALRVAKERYFLDPSRARFKDEPLEEAVKAALRVVLAAPSEILWRTLLVELRSRGLTVDQTSVQNALTAALAQLRKELNL